MTIAFARPVHPGEFLREEYLLPLDMSAGALAKNLGLPRTRIERIAKEEVGITPDTALRLGKYFNTTPEFWMNFQLAWELRQKALEIARELEQIEPRPAEAA